MSFNIIISHTKTIKLNYKYNGRQPIFIENVNNIVNILKDYSINDFIKYFKVNKKIAQDCFNSYHKFNNQVGNALLSYNGLTFKNIGELSDLDINYINDRLFILSALYGCLKSKDLISNYRLDYDTKLPNINIKDYYNYNLYQQMSDLPILNLASIEYSNNIKEYCPKELFINCLFLVNKNNKLTNVPTLSKIHRGRMLRYIIINRIDNIKDIVNYNNDNFIYNKDLSDNNKYIFIKDN